jgi:hypothetical protein
MRGRHLIVFRHVVAALLGFALGGAALFSIAFAVVGVVLSWKAARSRA